jgi:hypothetical protein
VIKDNKKCLLGTHAWREHVSTTEQAKEVKTVEGKLSKTPQRIFSTKY